MTVYALSIIDKLLALADGDQTARIEAGIVTSWTGGIPRSVVCEVVEGPRSGTECLIGLSPLSIGAGGECDLVIDDSRISRRHVVLSRTAGGIRVKDCGSTNGTFWQSSRIEEAVVPPGATIRIGGTKIHLRPARPVAIPPSARTAFGGLVGESRAMREVFAILELVSPSDATVLIAGESGTGKELVARAIHDHSPRAAGPFVIVDCGALTETLVESTLFGHVKGAFTGASSDRAGAFVQADGGTVFIDEIGELPLLMQSRLLRALEAKTVRPVGADRDVQFDTRVVAATNRDLRQQVEAEEFRFDLFHRLAVVEIHVPPLRQRPEDIVCLVDRFLSDRGYRGLDIAGPNLEILRQHHWPGNVRELRNTLERGVVFAGDGFTEFADLVLSLLRPSRRAPEPGATEVFEAWLELPLAEARERWIAPHERRYVESVHTASGGKISVAAEHAGVSRRTFRALLKKYGLYAYEGDDG